MDKEKVKSTHQLGIYVDTMELSADMGVDNNAASDAPMVANHKDKSQNAADNASVINNTPRMNKPQWLANNFPSEPTIPPPGVELDVGGSLLSQKMKNVQRLYVKSLPGFSQPIEPFVEFLVHITTMITNWTTWLIARTCLLEHSLQVFQLLGLSTLCTPRISL